MSERKKLLRGYLFVIASAVIFGCMPLMTKALYAQGLNSMSVVLLRNALSLPALAVLAIKQGGLAVRPKALPSIGLLALMGCCLTPVLLFSSYRYIASGTATVFHFVYPAAVILLGILFWKRRPQWAQLVCVAVCVAGICLFFDPSQTVHPLGSALALLSGITYAVYILLLSSFRHRDIAGFRLSFCIAAVSTLLLLAVCLCGRMLTLPTTLSGWCCAFALALTVNVGAVVLFQQGTFLVGGERASILSTFEPITGVLLGVLVFRETVGARTLLGTCLVLLAAVCIAAWDMRKTK
jgi:drug/metabolite transporter (DMT)-like permease